LNCPKCLLPTKVNETRMHESNTVRRRRECLTCGKTFTTVEMLLTDLKRFAKSMDQVIEAFSDD
jgi:transcriptional repressor NrdR